MSRLAQEEFKQLIELLKNTSGEQAESLREEIEESEWLYDGSLAGSDLMELDLQGIYLPYVNLSKVNLNGANLSGATLWGVNLSQAFLVGANLERAQLDHTNLRRAYLAQANFSGTVLSHTNFTKSVFGETRLCNIDLGEAVGLDTVEHIFPSTVGTDTLLLSGNRIPENFLRGCGLPNSVIAFFRTTSIDNDFCTCFISYSHADKDFAFKLAKDLRNANILCWLDVHDLPAGAFVLDFIDRIIREHDITVLCCSQSALGSGWVDREMKIVFQEEEALYAKYQKAISKLIPIDLDGAIFDSGRFSSPMAGQIRLRNIINARQWQQQDDYETVFGRIITALKASRPKNPYMRDGMH